MVSTESVQGCGSPAIREQIQAIVDAGSLPEWETEEDRLRIIAISDLIEAAPRPVTDEEAQALTSVFGPDDALGVAWSLLHLMETAPNSMTAVYGDKDDHREFVDLLNARVANAAGLWEE